MVNIQIRGPLAHITANRFTENEITRMISSEKNISEIIYKNYGEKIFDNIFHQTFPILGLVRFMYLPLIMITTMMKGIPISEQI